MPRLQLNQRHGASRAAGRFAIATDSLAELLTDDGRHVPYQKKAIQSIVRHLNGLFQH